MPARSGPNTIAATRGGPVLGPILSSNNTLASFLKNSLDVVFGLHAGAKRRMVAGMPLTLNALRFANAGAPEVVILHGLLGASRNWVTVGRALARDFDVHVPDLRNHGESPHADSMRWSELLGDLEHYLDAHAIGRPVLVGHSLGGKIAMRYACERPDRVAKLVIVDIAAKAYPPYHDRKFRAMKRIPVAELGSRREADELLAETVEDWAMRQFLLTNLVRDRGSGAFRWQIALEALHASLPVIRQNSLEPHHRYPGAALLVRGETSDFVADGDAAEMRGWLPRLRESTVPGAGHNVHVENREGFLRALGELF